MLSASSSTGSVVKANRDVGLTQGWAVIGCLRRSKVRGKDDERKIHGGDSKGAH